MAIGRVRINFALSEPLLDWLKIQTGIVRIEESRTNETIVEFNMTGPEAQALKTAFMDKLIEVI